MISTKLAQLSTEKSFETSLNFVMVISSNHTSQDWFLSCMHSHTGLCFRRIGLENCFCLDICHLCQPYGSQVAINSCRYIDNGRRCLVAPYLASPPATPHPTAERKPVQSSGYNQHGHAGLTKVLQAAREGSAELCDKVQGLCVA